MKGRASLWRLWARGAPEGTGGQGDPKALGRRMHRTALILIGGGFLFSLVLGGWPWALGYAIGGGIAVANLELLRQAVTRTITSETTRVLPRLVSGSLLRFLGIGIVLFLVLKFLPVQVFALAIGLLVGPVALLAAGSSGDDDTGESA
ncbi:MAG: ATP synthase subunit I [Candidatus Methylomirabilales bacterium]